MLINLGMQAYAAGYPSPQPAYQYPYYPYAYDPSYQAMMQPQHWNSSAPLYPSYQQLPQQLAWDGQLAAQWEAHLAAHPGPPAGAEAEAATMQSFGPGSEPLASDQGRPL